MENYDFCKTQHLENPIADPRIGQSVPYQSVDILINSLPIFFPRNHDLHAKIQERFS